MIAACATDAYAAASMRHDGNKKFSAKEYGAAVEAYTEGKGMKRLGFNSHGQNVFPRIFPKIFPKKLHIKKLH